MKHSVQEALLDLLFPPACAFCGKHGVHGVCAECEKELPYCETPLHERTGIGKCIAPLRYDGAVRESLLRFKFHGGRGNAEGYGVLLAQAAAELCGGEFDVVTYVPVSDRRRRERGYDQAFLLAKELCRVWAVKPVTLLRKTRDNPAQSSLSLAEERKANVLGVYEAVNAEAIRDARILLVDDILTTGATLRECVRVLKAAGAQSVLCATLAASDEK